MSLVKSTDVANVAMCKVCSGHHCPFIIIIHHSSFIIHHSSFIIHHIHHISHISHIPHIPHIHHQSIINPSSIHHHQHHHLHLTLSKTLELASQVERRADDFQRLKERALESLLRMKRAGELDRMAQVQLSAGKDGFYNGFAMVSICFNVHWMRLNDLMIL